MRIIMTSENFCYWLQGYLEIEDPSNINEGKLQIIKDHLSLVFTKVTPAKSSQFSYFETDYELLDTKFTGCSSKPLC